MSAYASNPQQGPSSAIRNPPPSSSRSEPDSMTILENVMPGISEILQANFLRLVGQGEWKDHQNCASSEEKNHWDEERKELKKEVKRLKAELAKNSGESSTEKCTDKRVKNLQKKNADLQKDLKSKDKEIQELKRKLKETEGREKKGKAEFEKKVLVSNAKCEEMKIQVEQAERRVKSLESEKKEATDRMLDMEVANEQLKQEKVEVESKWREERVKRGNEIIFLKGEKERMVLEKCRFLVFFRELKQKTNFPEEIDDENLTSAFLRRMMDHVENLVEDGGAKYWTELERQNTILKQMDNLWMQLQLRSTAPPLSTVPRVASSVMSPPPAPSTLETVPTVLSNTVTPTSSSNVTTASSSEPQLPTEAIKMDTAAPTTTTTTFPLPSTLSNFPEYSSATTTETKSSASVSLEPQATSDDDSNINMETESTPLRTSTVGTSVPITSQPIEVLIKEEPISPASVPTAHEDLDASAASLLPSEIADTTISIKLEADMSPTETGEHTDPASQTSSSTLVLGSVVETPPISPDEGPAPKRIKLEREDTSSIPSNHSAPSCSRQVPLPQPPAPRFPVSASLLESSQGKIKIEVKLENNEEEECEQKPGPTIVSTSSTAPVPPPTASPPDIHTRGASVTEKKTRTYRTSKQYTPFVNTNEEHSVNTESSSEIFGCVCGSTYLYEQGLKAHIRKMTTEWKFKCDKCGQYFFYPYELNNHLTNPSNCENDDSNANRIGGNPLDTGEEEEPYFDLDEFLSQPVGDETTLFTPIQSTITTADTNNHEMRQPLHEGSKSHAPWTDNPDALPGYFYCICHLKFGSKSNLTCHVDYMTKEWKFTCEICHQTFFSLGYLKKHLSSSHQIVDPLKEYSTGCQLCGEMFQTRTQFCLHRKIKHNIPRNYRAGIDSKRKSFPPVPNNSTEPQPGTSFSLSPHSATEEEEQQNMEIDMEEASDDEEIIIPSSNHGPSL